MYVIYYRSYYSPVYFPAHILYSEVLPAEGVGLAIMNRLSRAAGFRTIDADEEA